MRSRIGLGVGWVLVTIAAIAVTFAAVGNVRGNVTDSVTPAYRVEAASTIRSTTTTATTASSATSPPQDSVSPTSAAVVATTVETYELIGGLVTIEVGDGFITLLGAVPKPGFTAEEDKNRPTRIEVEFESTSHKSKIRLDLVGDEVVADIEEEPED